MGNSSLDQAIGMSGKESSFSELINKWDVLPESVEVNEKQNIPDDKLQ